MRHPLPKSSNDLGVISTPETTSAVNNDPRPSGTSRRSFLGRGLAAAAVPATIVAGSNLANAAGNGPFPSYYPGSTKSKFQEIQRDEYLHNVLLTQLIQELGGTARPLATFKGIQNLTPTQFLAMADAFENTGVHAYYGAAPYFFNPSVQGSALSIALVEAYHAGFLNTLYNVPLIPNNIPLATPFTLAQVVSAVSPYIVSLNDGGNFPASFSTTPSAANDIAILNFALLLEQLEGEFYFYNVPALFP